MLVVIAIVGMLTGAFSASIFGIFHHTASSNAHMTAATNIEDAGRWISNDGQMSQNTDITPGAAPVSNINLSWTDPVNDDFYEIYYSLSGENLLRQKSINSVVQETRTVARYITSIFFSQPTGEERLFTASINSTGGSPKVSEGREYHVTLRASD